MKVSMLVVSLAVAALPVTAGAQLQEMRQTILGMD
jgi:hypothetical protein